MKGEDGRMAIQGRRVTRRQALRMAGIGLGSLSLSPLLAACHGATGAQTGPSGGFDWSAQKEAGEMVFANWPYYIDKKKVNGVVTHPSLDAFTKATGIKVDYLEIIDDYASFFGKIEPQLRAGQSTGYDVIMMGYPRWIPTMIALDYLLPLDDGLLPNFNKFAADAYKNPPYDPDHRHGVAFASGATGIGYDIEQTGREITSVMDLFDPAFKGHVGMFNDTEDLPNLTLLGMGVEPSESTPDDWKKAADLLIQQRDQGIVRSYYGQGYIGELEQGNVALTMAWSPDIHQANLEGYENLRFVVPEEGGLLWTDYMCIPQGAEHPLDAISWLDFAYKPEVAAMITSWLGAMSPVPGAQDVLREQGQHELANSPLVFPTPDMYSQLHPYRSLTPDEQKIWDDTFFPVVQG
jgi:spermidine/putrescine transport system substrate-binding protein